MSEKKSLAGIFLALAVVFAMIFSFSFIAVNADHDCTGESCPICETEVMCENVVQTVCAAAAVVMAVFAAVNISDKKPDYAPLRVSCVCDPIKLKVKL